MPIITDTKALIKRKHELIKNIDRFNSRLDEPKGEEELEEMKKTLREVRQEIQEIKQTIMNTQTPIKEEKNVDTLKVREIYSELNKYYETLVEEYRELKAQVQANVDKKKEYREYKETIKVLKDKEKKGNLTKEEHEQAVEIAKKFMKTE